MEILKEAKRLYELGAAVHWIKPNSKAPVKSGWSGPTRDPWDVVAKEYKPSYGLGVRLGASSKLDGGYLANIDVDIKSSDPRHQVEALSALNKKFPGLFEKAPIVKTGYGLRLFVKTKEPLPSGKITSSREETVVLMPTAEISAQQKKAVALGKITEEQLKAGYRVRPAWELDFMSNGRQVVMPPSIHPETKKSYLWQRPLNGHIPEVSGLGSVEKKEETSGEKTKSFDPVSVELKGSKLPDRIIKMILKGDDVSDRSAVLLPVTIAMLKSGFTRQQILSVLTDKETFLGETAYDHAKTTSRDKAAQWLLKYTIPKAEREADASRAFTSNVVTAKLSDIDAAVQEADLLNTNWQLKIKRSGKNGDGPPKETLQNVVLILENAVGEDLFKRDLFANRDFYGLAAPWGGVCGAALSDDDGAKIKHWLSKKFRFEPSKDTIFDAVTIMATKNSFHPIRDELDRLPAWDFKPRIDTWLSRNFEAKGPPEYLAQVFRKWLVASVTRTYEPGAKFDWMLLLEGAQGTGKSSFGSILFGDEYFIDWLPQLADKDAALGLQGTRCVEFGELDQMRRNEIETVKAFVTRRIDKVRPPYGKRWLESKRQCVFFGTTNRDEYLKDDTGNRRFNPIEVGKLNFKALARERDQLWAEALFIYRNCLEESLYLEGEAEDYARQIQIEKVVSDETTFMVDSLRKFFANLSKEESTFDASKFKITSLFSGIGGQVPLEKWPENARSLQFAGRALKILGAKKRKIDGASWWGIGPD